MDKTVKRAGDGAGREPWVKPEIETLNAREAMIPKTSTTEGGGASGFEI